MMPLASHDQTWKGAISDTVIIMWHWCWNQLHYRTRSCIAHCFNDLAQMNTVVLLTILLASYNQKSHVSCHFNYLGIANSVMPLLLLLPLHNANANGITWPKTSWCILFWLSWSNKWNGAIDDTWNHITQKPAWIALHDQNSYVAHCFKLLELMNKLVVLIMALAPHDADASAKGVKRLKTSCCISFWSSWMRKCGLCYWWCHHCHVMQTLASHDQKSHAALCFIHHDLANGACNDTDMCSMPR